MTKTFQLLCFSVVMISTAQAQNVNIPDNNFRAFLLSKPAINTNGDNEIQVSEAQAFSGTIDCSLKAISSMVGIEAFTSLDELQCQFNLLTSLDVSGCTALTRLRCYNNDITSLNLSGCTALEYLQCNNNLLSSINTSTNINLDVLICYSNQLTTLDVSANPNLTTLNCNENLLTTLYLNNNPNLAFLNCYLNQLTSLDLSTCIGLGRLECYGNLLTDLDVSASPSLNQLRCYNNQITSLDISNNPYVDLIWCGSNLLTSLNIKNRFDYFINENFLDNPYLTCIEVDSVYLADILYTNKDSIAHYNTNCAVGVEIIENLQINIYPNPASSVLNIESSEMVQSIEIFNVCGVSVQKESCTSFSVSSLPVGTYFINVVTDRRTYNRRFIKE